MSKFVEVNEKVAKNVMVKEDTGSGMLPEVGVHIFEKFFRGDISHTTCTCKLTDELKTYDKKIRICIMKI